MSVLVLLTGFYPAWLLTSYQPIAVLKGSSPTTRLTQLSRGVLLRKGLVITQFAVSVGLIVCTIAVWQQVRFMRQQPLGFDQQKVVLIDLKEVSSRTRAEQARTLRDELVKHSQITKATACVAVPGQMGWDGQFAYGEGNVPNKGILVEHIPVDQAYIQTLQLTLLAGRDFVPNSRADEQQSFLINESAVKAFGWKNPQAALGKKLGVSGVNGQVIGVLKNYHQHGLQEIIRPVVMNVMPVANFVAIRYEGKDPALIVSHMKSTWQRLFPGYSLTFSFLDEAFQQQYVSEQKLIQTFTLGACLTILISCLGLFGLATFMAERRTKEIGVRKVLGASVGSIVTLLSKDFLKLVLIAIVIASPLAWYVMNEWLQDFAYKIDIEWWVFALAGLLAVGIALLTVSFQSIKAALMNPVKSLRSE